MKVDRMELYEILNKVANVFGYEIDIHPELSELKEEKTE